MIYYEAFKEDFDRIRQQMELEYAELAKYAEDNFSVPIEVLRPKVGFDHDNADELALSSIVVCAIKALTRDMEIVPDEVWHTFVDIYNEVEKTKVIDGKKIDGSPARAVHVPDSYQDDVDTIALYIRDLNIRIPYILRNGKGSIQIVALIGVYYVSNYLLEEKEAVT